MAEEAKEKNAEGYQFIHEKIVPKRKSRWKKRLLSVGFTIVLAVLFGVIAQLTSLLAREPLKRLLGIEETGRQEVNLPLPTLTNPPQPSMMASNTPPPPPPSEEAPQPTQAPSAISGQPPLPSSLATPEPTDGPTAISGQPPLPSSLATPEPTKDLPLPSRQPSVPPTEPEPTSAEEVTDPSENRPADVEQGGVSGDWYSYAMLYGEITELAAQAMKSVVTIEAVELGVDWFQETYETKTSMTGLILANDGVDLLILTGSGTLALADWIEVRMGESIVKGRLFSLDADYGLAVVAVALDGIPAEVLGEVQLANIAAEGKIRLGTPVIALGAPNGYDGSMEFGMVTGVGSSVPVTDGQVSYFTTNLTDYAQGYGFLLNLDGEVLGMLTHTHKINVNDGVSSAVSLDAMRGIIVKLLNASDMVYFGIQGENLPLALKQASGVSHGVYVKSVENASPALAAGIKTGDVLIAAGGNELFGVRDFIKVLLATRERETLTVTLLRTTGDGIREMTVDVVLARKSVK